MYRVNYTFGVSTLRHAAYGVPYPVYRMVRDPAQRGGGTALSLPPPFYEREHLSSRTPYTRPRRRDVEQCATLLLTMGFMPLPRIHTATSRRSTRPATHNRAWTGWKLG